MAAKKRESALEKEIREYAEATGWWGVKFVSPGTAGVPDRLFIRGGMVLFMEVKRKGKKPTRQQYLRMAEIRKHGAIVCWVDSFAAAKEWLDFV